jgi:predicted RNA binding protein YcfA (HicA-like mRNA interferase family)
MRLPRGVSGQRVIRALSHLGYAAVRQSGSHVRLQHPSPPVHTITVPLHDVLKVGTLHSILTEVAERRSTTVDALIELL